ncbi:LuxR family transcriptional regulator [Pseudomethylobacillus aquaticus]|uniref:LuxR family transcriptional regulator n=1 Tax=Pseudomethylobacillus aquaticus TaxID=2676064 RepID=A0A3N0V5K2_9PROT|nr:helix-turn-helix transcriptional regulator [Pseudomethylobacillus aquaticus]ROH88087.1 LuxR family transcriptional regulator [Pseudomethylobacillus aquaticus]
MDFAISIKQGMHFSSAHEQHARILERPGTNNAQPSSLTDREIQVMEWISEGKTNGEIASILAISHNTVKFHVQNILNKLNVFNRIQALSAWQRMHQGRGEHHHD